MRGVPGRAAGLEAEEALHLLGVGGVHLGAAAQAALASRALLLEDVVEEGLPATDLARPGHLEPLGGALVGLHLRHVVRSPGWSSLQRGRRRRCRPAAHRSPPAAAVAPTAAPARMAWWSRLSRLTRLWSPLPRRWSVHAPWSRGPPPAIRRRPVAWLWRPLAGPGDRGPAP